MSLLEADVPVQNVITTDPQKASALENNVRAKLLDMLANREMTVKEMRAELERRGEDKAETTVRHHLSVLTDAGMVEIARLEEAGGGTRKHYRSNTRVYSYDLPDGSEAELDEAHDAAREGVAEMVERLHADHGEEIEAVAREMKPCEYCRTQHYKEFVLRELLNRALTDLDEDGSLEGLLSRTDRSANDSG
jgi:DNA-binding transcriptional ArsR family regulator